MDKKKTDLILIVITVILVGVLIGGFIYDRNSALLARTNYFAINEDPNLELVKMEKAGFLYMRAGYQAKLQIKNGALPPRPVTVIFGGKAAPAYRMAKNVIHLILCLQELINNDPFVSQYLKVVMVQNYNIDKAEKIIPACDISEQISLASKEASGTGNMKFMLNGAVTLGTADGANVEIRNLVGNDNIYIFGKTSDEVIGLYNTSSYHSADYYYRSNSIHRCVDFIAGEELCAIGDRFLLNELKDNLINKDWFMTLLDLESYCAAKETALMDYENRAWWKRKMLVNIAKSGFFSSDRTITEYNNDIWHLR